MGICGLNGDPIYLTFDCISYGTHGIYTKDGISLEKVIEILCKIIRVPRRKITSVLYNYEVLNTNNKIKDLNLPDGAVLSVKIANWL